MADVNIQNAKIFIQMQSADAMRKEAREGILNRFRQSSAGKAMGKAHDGISGAMNDVFRRTFEQPWYGKDIFDGRWHMDVNINQGDAGGQSEKGMDNQHDQRASFYGWSNNGENGVEANEPEPEEEQKYEMEPEEEQEIEP